MLKIENIEFGSYELNPNDYFFDITPDMVSMMQLALENKKQYKYVPDEDYTIVEGVTTNSIMKTIMTNDRNEYERLMDKVRSKLDKQS